MNKRGIGLMSLILLFGGIACSSTSEATTPEKSPPTATTEPSGKGGRTKIYENRAAHFKLQYPADWVSQTDPDYVLVLAPPGTSDGDKNNRVTVDVPDLPPHLPGMITIGKVKSGYLDDLRKRLKNMKVTEDSQQSIPKAKAERVVVTGKENGQDRTIPALLMIHSERVYIIRADTETKNAPQAKAVWEEMISTLQWTK